VRTLEETQQSYQKESEETQIQASQPPERVAQHILVINKKDLLSSFKPMHQSGQLHRWNAIIEHRPVSQWTASSHEFWGHQIEKQLYQ